MLELSLQIVHFVILLYRYDMIKIYRDHPAKAKHHIPHAFLIPFTFINFPKLNHQTHFFKLTHETIFIEIVISLSLAISRLSASRKQCKRSKNLKLPSIQQINIYYITLQKTRIHPKKIQS